MKRYLVNFSTNPTSLDTELLLIVIIIPQFIVPNIDFIRRLDSDGLWLQSRLKPTNDWKHEKRRKSCPKYRGKIHGKSGQLERRDFLIFFIYFNIIKSNQSARTEVFEQFKRNCVEIVVKWSSLHSISARITKASKRVKISRNYRIGWSFSIPVVRYLQIQRNRCL